MIAIAWSDRSVPLAPAGAWADGDVAVRLADRLLRMPVTARTRLEGVSTEDTLVVFGAAEDLPWVDGITYLGRDPAAPSLLVPTRQSPNVSMALLGAAIGGGPCAVLLDPPRIVSLSNALPVGRETLERWSAQRR